MRGSRFWASEAVKGCPSGAWVCEAMSIALARYLDQEAVAADVLAVPENREEVPCGMRQNK